MNALAPISSDDPFGTGEQNYRLPPHNEAAEQGLLGALLVHDALLEAVGEIVTADDFYMPVHGRIYEACQSIAAGGRRADPVTLRAHFEADKSLSDVGGAEYLARLAGAAIPAASVAKDYARAIADCALRRRLIEMMQDATEAAWGGPGGERLVETMETALFALADRRSASAVMSIGRALTEMLMEAERQSTGEVVPVDTGLRDLDTLMDGLMPGDLTVAAARPGVGKTSLATGIALHNAAKGRAVGMFQLEMRGAQMAARVLSETISIPAKPILRGRLHYDQWERAEEARKGLNALPFYIDARAGVPLDQFIPRARRMKRQHGIELLIVDYLGLVRVPGASAYERVTQVSQTMKELARDLDIHVLALHQLNRGNEKEARRPSMSDLRDSGAVEQDADNILLIHREEMSLKKAEPDPSESARHAEWAQRMAQAQGKAEIIVDKQRNGATGTVLLRFDARTTTFRDGE
jgi:replicative DNA helicase